MFYLGFGLLFDFDFRLRISGKFVISEMLNWFGFFFILGFGV